MYEDSWYSFVPETQARKDGETPQKSHHRRRESLLKQPNESDHTDHAQPVSMGALFEEGSISQGPPQATLAKRAKSYTDFYHVARAHIRREANNAKEKSKFPSNLLDTINQPVVLETQYEAFNDDLLGASHEEYRIYRDQLALSERHLDNLVKETESALDLLANLSDAFKTVASQTTAFQAQCEDLLHEQQRVKDLADKVGTDLQYYSYLEPITRRLNAPGASRVIGDDSFVEMLTNLDACIEFMIDHPQHRESDTYLTRYKSLLAKTLNLIQIKFSNTLRDRTSEARNRSKEDRLNMTTVYLIQAPDTPITGNFLEMTMKYIVQQAKLAFDLRRVSSRRNPNQQTQDHLATYNTLFRSTLIEYVRSRETLIPEIVQKFLGGIIKDTADPETDFPQYARASIQAVLEICSNEHAKYTRMFLNQSDLNQLADDGAFTEFWRHLGPFAEFLNSISQQAVSTFETYLQRLDLPTAVDLVIWLDTNYNVSNGGSKLDDDGEDYLGSTQSTVLKGEDQVKVAQAGQIKARIIGTIFSRMREILLKDVEHYNPSTEDLRLKTTSNSVEKPANEEDVGDEAIAHHDVEARVRKALGPSILSCYPPVKTAIKLLIFHHDLTFDSQGTPTHGSTANDEMAYEIMHTACSAVMRFETQLSKKSVSAGKLAAIKNLVLLKNLILAYEISGSRQVAALDFTRMLNTFSELQSRGSLFDIRAYYRLISTGELLPQVITSVKDARTELDGLLREMITQFREQSANSLWELKSRSPLQGSWKIKQELLDLIKQYFEHEPQLRDNLWAAVEETIEARKRG